MDRGMYVFTKITAIMMGAILIGSLLENHEEKKRREESSNHEITL